MRWLATLVCGAVLAALSFAAAAQRDAVADPYAAAGSFVVLSYHEARDDVRDYPDPYAVDAAALVRQFAWLRGNGYAPVSLEQIVAARAGGKPLPARAVLLTFDDGYLSFYTRVYPLLREFRFPAMLAVVGKWIDGQAGAVPAVYGEKDSIPAAEFPTWAQIREMADSGLVEIASHTYDLHRGVLANPQANLQPAATARIYDTATGRYEDDASWRARVRADLAKSADVIARETGRRPRAIVWPYGSYNDELVRMAGELGMTIGMTLDEGPNTPDVPLTAMRRNLLEHNPTLAEFIVEVRVPQNPLPVRVVQVNLDEVYSADAALQERNLSALLDRMLVLKPSHVYLQATADTNGDGVADAAYFPNRHLPVRADLFNRAAWQLASRVDVKLYAVMPVTGLQLPRGAIGELYEDLARHANFDGLVFDDRRQAGADDAGTLGLTRELTRRVRAFRAPLMTARVMYVDMSPAGISQYAGTGAVYAAAYGYVVVTPNAANGSASDADTSLSTFAARMEKTSASAGVRRRTVFMLKNGHSSTDRGSRDALARQMRELQRAGALNFGYSADDFRHDDPPLAQIAPALSLREYPMTPLNRAR